MAKLLLISNSDSNFYYFRKEKIIKFKELGYDVILVCPYGEKIDYFKERGCRFIDLKIDRRGTNPLKDFILCHNYLKIIKKEKPDVVLTYTSKSSLYAALMSRMARTPVIVNNSGLINSRNYPWYLGKILDILYKICFAKVDCMMYQNSEERDYLNKLLNNKNHYRDIPGSGVNLSRFKFSPYPKESNKVIFNFVARIVGFKGISEYLTCAEKIKVKYPQTEFRIFGGYDDDTFENRISDLEKGGIIKYMGLIHDMTPFIAESSALIHPSHYEGMSNVVLEHSACGRPVIGANISGIKEAVEDGFTGFLFKVGDETDLIAKVEQFLALSHSQKTTMGKAAHDKTEKGFDRKYVISIYLEEINSILKKLK